jgi:hypothetical protein
MRTLKISMVAAGLALGVAAPAAAQYNYYPTPNYNYQPYNYGYGWNAPAFTRAMQDRVRQIRNDIRNMGSRGVLSPLEVRRLDYEAWDTDRYIQRASYSGLYPAEARAIENKVRRLERHIMREASDPNRRNEYRRY